MALNSITRKNNQGRDIKYLNKDFAAFRQNLVEYAKTYFPQTYSDFNESSPGMLFIEMASYLGDVLSYYIDDSLKESMMLYAEDRENVIALAKYLGYKPRAITPAIVTLAVYQLIPSTGTGANNQPDSRYFLRIREGMLVESTSTGAMFRTSEMLDFADPTDREITVHEKDTVSGEPTFYLAKKYVKALSGTLKTIQKSFTSPQQYSRIDISDTNVVDIYDVRDSNGNKWYEVPYLAQEMVYVDYPINEYTDTDLETYNSEVSSVLKLIKTSRRFVTELNADNSTSIVFGGGNATSPDETLIPTFKNVGLGLPASIDKMGESFDPANFLKTKSYGQAPYNTTITVSYIVGGGIESNVPAGDLVQIQRIEFEDEDTYFRNEELPLVRQVKTSVAAENETPARGGRGPETVEEIRQNAMANFSSQNRAVTAKDYQVRALSMPSRFGGVAKAFARPYGKRDDRNFAINLYILGYDSNKYLATLNQAVKENLKTYINEYRVLTDGVNIIDGFIINIGVNFEIRVYAGYNKREVLVNAIQAIRNYFNIDNWTFNMPINISEIELLVAGIEGVQSVPSLEIINKCLGNYSIYSYNIQEATKGKMVYPSLDPSCFELKFPDKDIKGKVV